MVDEFTTRSNWSSATTIGHAGSTRSRSARPSFTDGVAISDEDWAGMSDAAMATGEIAEMYIAEARACDEGGSFTVGFHNRFDFATFEFEARQDVGTWEITGASGALEGLSGSGDVTLDRDAGRVSYDPEAQRWIGVIATNERHSQRLEPSLSYGGRAEGDQNNSARRFNEACILGTVCA